MARRSSLEMPRTSSPSGTALTSRSASTRAHSSAARPIRSTSSTVPTSASRASRRLASRISSTSWSSSAMLRRISARKVGEGVCPPISSSPMRMRVSGERSSCEALASRDLCDFTSVSIRSADALNCRARSATSSCPVSGTRTDRSPSPNFFTLRCRASSRSVSRRMTGYTPRATATPMMPSIHTKPKGGRSQKATVRSGPPPGGPPGGCMPWPRRSPRRSSRRSSRGGLGPSSMVYFSPVSVWMRKLMPSPGGPGSRSA